MAKIVKALKNAATDVKAGVKNIPNMYNALYNQKVNPNNPHSPGLGVKQTVKNNVGFITNTKPVAKLGQTPAQAKKQTNIAKAKLVGLGAASVTPLGPVVGFAAGVAKSKADRKAKGQ